MHRRKPKQKTQTRKEKLSKKVSFEFDGEKTETQMGGSNTLAETEKRARMERAKTYIDALNGHDIQTIRALLTQDFEPVFNGELMIASQWVKELQKLIESFPDLSFSHSHITVNGQGEAVIHNVRVTGTHTGAPFGYGPYLDIEATGKKVRNDPETFVLSFQGDKIANLFVIAKGNLTGPPGFYTQLGGFPV